MTKMNSAYLKSEGVSTTLGLTPSHPVNALSGSPGKSDHTTFPKNPLSTNRRCFRVSFYGASVSSTTFAAAVGTDKGFESLTVRPNRSTFKANSSDLDRQLKDREVKTVRLTRRRAWCRPSEETEKGQWGKQLLQGWTPDTKYSPLIRLCITYVRIKQQEGSIWLRPRVDDCP